MKNPLSGLTNLTPVGKGVLILLVVVLSYLAITFGGKIIPTTKGKIEGNAEVIQQPAKEGSPIMRGSSTLAPVMAEMAQAFKQRGGDIGIVQTSSGEGIKALLSGEIQIAMSSRPMKPEEKQGFKSDMGGSEHEIIVGLDALVIQVHSGNGLIKITKTILANIFSGRITDWSQVPGSGLTGAINTYGYSEKHGTADTFKTMVLEGSDARVKPFENGDDVSNAVENDPNGIGYASFAFVNRNKVLAVAGDEGLQAMKPSKFTIKSEGYPLCRRLYLYVDASSPEIRKFIDFVISDEGQRIMGGKFVSMELTTSKEENVSDVGSPVGREFPGAVRLSTDLRFKTGSSNPDNRAIADIKRIVNLLSERPRKVILAGFADNVGSSKANQELSEKRASSIGDLLALEGLQNISVRGYGSINPVASNDTIEGKERNRRVEIWVAQ